MVQTQIVTASGEGTCVQQRWREAEVSWGLERETGALHTEAEQSF